MNSDPFAKTEKNSAKQLLEGGSREDIVVRALQECQAALDAGNSIDRDSILAKYPEIRDELSACLDGLELMKPIGIADPTEPSKDARTVIQQSLTPSATLGDFRIERELGRGGMGVVYEAEQLSVGRKVALKVLPYAAMLDKRQVARFQNEARAAATLEHPNIVPVYFVGNERGVYYYAMRLIDGKNLAEVLDELRGNDQGEIPLSQVSSQLLESVPDIATDSDASASLAKAETVRDQAADQSTSLASDHATRGRLYFESVARLAKQAAEALDFAHSHGIIHRDIKPANIMLDDLGDAWVTDFGLARIEADAGMTMTGDIVGTLRYMSPEQTLAKRVTVDHRSDVYSLGATIYELLTFTPLFDGADRADLLKKIAFDDPKPPSKVVKGIPADLETIVLKSLHKNPDDRYLSAKEYAEDLERFLLHQPVLARRTPISQRIRMWARRHPGAVASAAIVTSVLLIATAVLGFISAHHQSVLRSQEQTASEQIAASLSEKENALDAANANLNEALNAIDRFLVELSGESGNAISKSSPLRAEMIQSAFEIYNRLGEDQMTPELERRKLMALMRAARLDGNHEVERFAEEGVALADRLLAKSPHDLQVLFAKINLFGHRGFGQVPVEDRIRSVYAWLEQQVKHFKSAENMFDSKPEHHEQFAEAMMWAVMLNREVYDALDAEEWTRLRQYAALLINDATPGTSPKTTEMTNQLAALAAKQGDTESAYQILSRALELAPEVPLHSDLIDVVLAKDGIEAARAYCEEQLRRHELSLIKYPLADRSWDYPRLQDRLADLIARDPDNLSDEIARLERESSERHPLIRRHVLLASLYKHVGELDKAIAAHNQALTLIAPGEYAGQTTPGQLYDLYVSKGDLQSAAKALAASNEAHLVKLRALAEFKLGDYDLALKSYRSAFDLNPRDMSTITWITPAQQGPNPGFENPEWIAGRKALLEHMVDRYDELIASTPDEGRYWHGRATAKRHLGRNEEALEDNLRAAELRSTEENQSEYAYCLLHLAAVYRALGRYEDETETLLKCIEARANHKESTSSNSVVFYMSYLAESYVRRGMDTEATATWKRATELDPQSARSWFFWAKDCAEHGDLETAVDGYTRVLEIDPSQNGAYTNRGLAYQQLGDFRRAVEDFNKVIERNPQSDSAWHARGHAYEDWKKTDLAVRDFVRASELGHPSAFSCQMNALIKARRFGEVSERYTEAIASDPTNSSLLNNAAWHFATSPAESARNASLAVEFATKVCELTDWKDGGFLDTLAAAYAESGDFESAVKWQTKALEMAPEALKDDIRSRLDLYNEGKPFREE